jgi:imidazole glycerol-phosphate synthase subunit HisF
MPIKLRIIPTLLFKNVGLVKGIRFDSWRRVGATMQAIKVYNMRQVDELIFLDISATQEGRRPDFATVDEIADECFMPLCVGGGIRSLEDVRKLLAAGADKVAVNTAAVERPELIREISEHFGNQCVVVSIDARREPDGTYRVYTHSGTRRTEITPEHHAAAMNDAGAGEILITSVDRDGTMEGYDVELTRSVSNAVSVPVIASGGAGNYAHMLDVIRDAGASAVAAASIYHFTQHTPLEAKHYLAQHNIPVRL